MIDRERAAEALVTAFPGEGFTEHEVSLVLLGMTVARDEVLNAASDWLETFYIVTGELPLMLASEQIIPALKALCAAPTEGPKS